MGKASIPCALIESARDRSKIGATRVPTLIGKAVTLVAKTGCLIGLVVHDTQNSRRFVYASTTSGFTALHDHVVANFNAAADVFATPSDVSEPDTELFFSELHYDRTLPSNLGVRRPLAPLAPSARSADYMSDDKARRATFKRLSSTLLKGLLIVAHLTQWRVRLLIEMSDLRVIGCDAGHAQISASAPLLTSDFFATPFSRLSDLYVAPSDLVEGSGVTVATLLELQRKRIDYPSWLSSLSSSASAAAAATTVASAVTPVSKPVKSSGTKRAAVKQKAAPAKKRRTDDDAPSTNEPAAAAPLLYTPVKLSQNATPMPMPIPRAMAAPGSHEFFAARAALVSVPAEDYEDSEPSEPSETSTLSYVVTPPRLVATLSQLQSLASMSAPPAFSLLEFTPLSEQHAQNISSAFDTGRSVYLPSSAGSSFNASFDASFNASFDASFNPHANNMLVSAPPPTSEFVLPAPSAPIDIAHLSPSKAAAASAAAAASNPNSYKNWHNTLFGALSTIDASTVAAPSQQQQQQQQDEVDLSMHASLFYTNMPELSFANFSSTTNDAVSVETSLAASFIEAFQRHDDIGELGVEQLTFAIDEEFLSAVLAN